MAYLIRGRYVVADAASCVERRADRGRRGRRRRRQRCRRRPVRRSQGALSGRRGDRRREPRRHSRARQHASPRLGPDELRARLHGRLPRGLDHGHLAAEDRRRLPRHALGRHEEHPLRRHDAAARGLRARLRQLRRRDAREAPRPCRLGDPRRVRGAHARPAPLRLPGRRRVPRRRFPAISASASAGSWPRSGRRPAPTSSTCSRASSPSTRVIRRITIMACPDRAAVVLGRPAREDPGAVDRVRDPDPPPLRGVAVPARPSGSRATARARSST